MEREGGEGGRERNWRGLKGRETGREAKKCFIEDDELAVKLLKQKWPSES